MAFNIHFSFVNVGVCLHWRLAIFVFLNQYLIHYFGHSEQMLVVAINLRVDDQFPVIHACATNDWNIVNKACMCDLCTLPYVSYVKAKYEQIHGFWLLGPVEPNIVDYRAKFTLEKSLCLLNRLLSLWWRHSGRDGVSNHRRLDGLLKHLVKRRSKWHQSPVSLALVRGIHRSVNSPKRASNAENVSIWWRHHGLNDLVSLSSLKWSVVTNISLFSHTIGHV